MLFAGLGMAVASAYSFEVQMNDVQYKKPAVAGFLFYRPQCRLHTERF